MALGRRKDAVARVRRQVAEHLERGAQAEPLVAMQRAARAANPALQLDQLLNFEEPIVAA